MTKLTKIKSHFLLLLLLLNINYYCHAAVLRLHIPTFHLQSYHRTAAKDKLFWIGECLKNFTCSVWISTRSWIWSLSLYLGSWWQQAGHVTVDLAVGLAALAWWVLWRILRTVSSWGMYALHNALSLPLRNM